MKLLQTTLMLVIVCFSVSCKREAQKNTEQVIYMAPLEVGYKTADYEVVSANQLKLAPGVKIKVLPKGPNGENRGFVLLRPNGSLGGFMSCECSGSTSGNCSAEDDNPDHPVCSGGCNDSEGNPHGCSLVGPLTGPPRSPYSIMVMSNK